MNRKRMVITGAPGTGKTSIVTALQNKGYFCFEEISRSVIQEYQQKGITNPFISHAQEFSEILFEKRILQYLDFKELNAPIAFYDRSFIDVIAYLQYGDTTIKANYFNTAKQYVFDTIFLTPPWEEIYKKDKERLENFEQAKTIHKHMVHTYQNFGYNIITIPNGTITERVAFIESKLS